MDRYSRAMFAFPNAWALALVGLALFTFASLRRREEPDAIYVVAFGFAIVTTGVWLVSRLSSSWGADLSLALLASIAACQIAFAASCFVFRSAWRLSVVIVPYLLLLSVVTVLSGAAEPGEASPQTLTAWLYTHIFSSVFAYGLLTVAAMSSLAILFQEKALKTRNRGMIAASLPAIADAERIEIQLLYLTGAFLGIGMLVGIAAEFEQSGQLIELNHKTLFSIAAFLVITCLLAVHRSTGLRGRKAARLVLISYLLISLGYPGVKFVRDVLLAS